MDDDVLIEFDGESELVRYCDVLGIGKYNVVSDASPSLGQVTLEAKVCFRIPISTNSGAPESSPSHAFVVGTVSKILVKPKRFVVQMLAKNACYVVKRADLRLVQPPWWDELEEGLEDCDTQRPEAGG